MSKNRHRKSGEICRQRKEMREKLGRGKVQCLFKKKQIYQIGWSIRSM